MNIKKQIILDDKDYERLVHDANLSNDEIRIFTMLSIRQYMIILIK